MKRSIYPFVAGVVLCSLGSMRANAQVVIPDRSPRSTISQNIGFSELRIEYSRPSVRGRIIFGELVPYGKVWRVGANASTKIYLSDDVTIEDQYKLQAGLYALYAIPEKDEWTVIFSRNTQLWGAFGYTPERDALRIRVKPQQLKEQVETFTIETANICDNCAELQLLWDFTKVSFRIGTDIDNKIMADIKAFTANPEAKLSGEYYLAGRYYFETGRDLNQALEWVNKAIDYGPEAYWILHTKAEILAKMGDYKAAIETANLSKEKAKAANNADYIRMNEREIEKWKALKKSGTD